MLKVSSSTKIFFFVIYLGFVTYHRRMVDCRTLDAVDCNSFPANVPDSDNNNRLAC